MAGGPGVSTAALADGRWRVRWRENVTDGTTTKRVQRERVVRDQSTAMKLSEKILRKIEAGELFEDPVRVEIKPASLDAVLNGWLRGRAARGLSPNTIESYGGRIARVLRTWRAMLKLDEKTPVPGSVLTRDGIVKVTAAMRADGQSEGTLHGTIQTLVSAWSWASDDAATYPGITPAPRDTSDLALRPPVYGETTAPTMAECDEVIKRVRALGGKADRIALPVSVIARCTGLRCGQVLGIRACDVNLDEALLTVVTGKGRRETSQRRTVPIAPVLVPFLKPYVEAALAVAPTAPLFPRRADSLGQSRGGPNKTLARCWSAAADAKKVRREVWAPENRVVGRPDHAFRAAFQAHLVEGGVADAVINILVGHAGGLRDVHYGGAAARMGAMRKAVALIPPLPF